MLSTSSLGYVLIETVCVAPYLRGRRYVSNLFYYIASNEEANVFVLYASSLKDQNLNQQKRLLIYEKLGFHLPLNTVVKYIPVKIKLSNTSPNIINSSKIYTDTIPSREHEKKFFIITNISHNGERFIYTIRDKNDENSVSFNVMSSDIESCYDDNNNNLIEQSTGCLMHATRSDIIYFTQSIFNRVNPSDSVGNQDDNCGGGSCETRPGYLGGERPNLSTDVPKFERIVETTKRTKRTKRTKKRRRISKKIHLRKKSFNSKLRGSHAPKSKTSRRKIKH